jgi:tetratricopeptide (TPR) repeat protein
MRKYLGFAFLLLLFWRLRFLGQMVTMNGQHVGLVTAVFNDQATANPVAGQPQTIPSLQARALAKLDPTQAEFWLQQGVEGNGRSLTYFELCRLYWQERRREEAINVCQTGSVPATYWVNVGLQAEGDGNGDLALAAYETAVAVDPELASAWMRLGGRLVGSEQYTQAISALEKALALGYPPHVQIYNWLSQAYLQAGQLEKGRQVLLLGIESFAENRSLMVNLADSYMQSGDWQSAAEWYERLTTENPEDTSAWIRRGNIALQSGEVDQAILYYEQATILEPTNQGAWQRLAEAAREDNNVSLATQAYMEALRLAPNNINLWMGAGRFFVQTGQIERAKNSFQHVLEQDPEHERAFQELSDLP